MSEDGRIELAHAADFTLGSLSVRPPTREVESDGTVELLEPRVMQVLVALARADGAILSRDDLIRQCWEGRIVGEDAINRVLSRLRRTAEGIGQGCFRIETITKVAEISDRDYQRILNSGEPDGALQDYAHTFGRITDVEVTDLVLDEDPVTPLSFPIDSTTS